MITIHSIDKMKERDFAEFARGVPAFTARQAAALVGGPAYAKVYLHRMVSRGIVRRLGKGLFTAHSDPVIYASHIRYPSYISLWYAFQHHGATTQLPNVVEVMSHRAGNFRNAGVELIRTGRMWGFGPAMYSGFRVIIANLEKAVIDAVLTGRIPDDETAGAVGKCDPQKLEDYVLRLDLSSLRKVCYVAEMGGLALERARARAAGDRNYAHLGRRVMKNHWQVVR